MDILAAHATAVMHTANNNSVYAAASLYDDDHESIDDIPFIAADEPREDDLPVIAAAPVPEARPRGRPNGPARPQPNAAARKPKGPYRRTAGTGGGDKEIVIDLGAAAPAPPRQPEQAPAPVAAGERASQLVRPVGRPRKKALPVPSILHIHMRGLSAAAHHRRGEGAGKARPPTQDANAAKTTRQLLRHKKLSLKEEAEAALAQALKRRRPPPTRIALGAGTLTTRPSLPSWLSGPARSETRVASWPARAMQALTTAAAIVSGSDPFLSYRAILSTEEACNRIRRHLQQTDEGRAFLKDYHERFFTARRQLAVMVPSIASLSWRRMAVGLREPIAVPLQESRPVPEPPAGLVITPPPDSGPMPDAASDSNDQDATTAGDAPSAATTPADGTDAAAPPIDEASGTGVGADAAQAAVPTAAAPAADAATATVVPYFGPPSAPNDVPRPEDGAPLLSDALHLPISQTGPDADGRRLRLLAAKWLTRRSPAILSSPRVGTIMATARRRTTGDGAPTRRSAVRTTVDVAETAGDDGAAAADDPGAPAANDGPSTGRRTSARRAAKAAAAAAKATSTAAAGAACSVANDGQAGGATKRKRQDAPASPAAAVADAEAGAAANSLQLLAAARVDAAAWPAPTGPWPPEQWRGPLPPAELGWRPSWSTLTATAAAAAAAAWPAYPPPFRPPAHWVRAFLPALPMPVVTGPPSLPPPAIAARPSQRTAADSASPSAAEPAEPAGNTAPVPSATL